MIKRMIFGIGEWISLDKVGEAKRTERWGMTFRSVLPHKSHVVAIDVLISQLALLSAGIGGGSCEACALMRLLDVAMCFLLVGLITQFRPYRRPLRPPIVVSAQVFFTLGCLILAVGYFSPDCPKMPPVNSDCKSLLRDKRRDHTDRVDTRRQCRLVRTVRK